MRGLSKEGATRSGGLARRFFHIYMLLLLFVVLHFFSHFRVSSCAFFSIMH